MMRTQLENTIIAYLVQHPNLINLHSDKLSSGLFNNHHYKAIYTDINTSVRNKLEINRYTLKNKYGQLIDDLLAQVTLANDPLEAFGIALNQLINTHTSERFSDLCSEYLANYHSGELIDHQKFLSQLSSEMVLTDDVVIYNNQNAMDYLCSELDNENPPGEIPVMIGKIDETLQGGGNRGEVMYLAARPKMFKTSFALNMFSMMTIKHHGLFFSLEMSAQELWKKQYGIVEGRSFEYDKSGKSRGQALSKYGDHVILTKKNAHIVDYPDMSIQAIKKLIKRHKLKHGVLDFIIVDNLAIIRKSKGKSEYDAITEITRELKVIAKEENIFIICIAQLNRGVSDRKDKRPILSDLRGSGSIEQDADFVVMLHREEYYYAETGKAAPEPIKNVLEVNFAAARRGQQNCYKFKVNLALGKVLHELSDFENAQYSTALNTASKSNGGGF